MTSLTMRAIVVRKFGEPEVLQVEDVPVPVIGPDELLIEVYAAGVNPVDVSNHQDGTWAGIALPYTPGSDASGVVREVGVNVTRFVPGDEVFSLTDFLCVRGGSYAELQAVPESLAVRKPAALSHVEASSIPLAAGTAYEMVIRRLDIQEGERVVIFGAAGGVGGFATQLAVARGAEVIAIARKDAHDYLRGHQVAQSVDYTADDVLGQIASEYGEVDAVVDLVGNQAVAKSLPLLRKDGRAATIVSLDGDLELAIDRNITLHGVLLRPDGQRLEELAQLIERGDLTTTVRGEHSLENAADAHREVLQGGVPGKTVIRVREPGRAEP